MCLLPGHGWPGLEEKRGQQQQGRGDGGGQEVVAAQGEDPGAAPGQEREATHGAHQAQKGEIKL